MTAKIRNILIPSLLLAVAVLWVTFGSNIISDGYGLKRDKLVSSPQLESTVPAVNSITDLNGYTTFLTFGFSHCDESCPYTLSQFVKLANVLPDDSRFIFVSVDNERDTLPHLTNFLAQIDPSIIGWTMSEPQLKKFAEQFNTHIAINTNSGHEHGSAIQLIDRNGRWVKTYPYLNLNENAVLKDYMALQQAS